MDLVFQKSPATFFVVGNSNQFFLKSFLHGWFILQFLINSSIISKVLIGGNIFVLLRGKIYKFVFKNEQKFKAILGWFLLGERLNGTWFIGAVMIIIGLVVMNAYTSSTDASPDVKGNKTD